MIYIYILYDNICVSVIYKMIITLEIFNYDAKKYLSFLNSLL